MIQALVMTHGRIGEELVRVVEMILGPTEGLVAISNHGLGADDLQQKVQEWLGEPGAGGGAGPGRVIFIDDFGGSCGTAAQLCCGPREDVAIIAGVNLAMLLGFVTWREDSDLDELAQQVIQKGREAITRLGK